MNVYISKIFILSKLSDIREVPLKQGINVITGNSKTGKSALIEIVDYCLCSKTSGIPKGEITKFGYLFGITLEFPTKKLVIGRKNILHGGLTRVYVSVEKKESIDLSVDFFEQKQPLLRKDAQVEIERHLGLSVADISDADDAEYWEKKKVGLREMTSFFFQHQNLIASKHALFYRFDNSFKKQATIDSFPVFAGLVSDEYFSLLRELDYREKELRKVLALEKKSESQQKSLDEKLKPFFRNYYALIGENFDESLSAKDLLALGKNLPKKRSTVFDTSELARRFNVLSIEADDLDAEIALLQKNVLEIDQTESYANNFRLLLGSLREKSAEVLPKTEDYLCPLCGNETESLNQEMRELNNAAEALKEELAGLSTYTISFQKERDSLKKKIRNLKGRRNEIQASISEIKRINSEIEKERSVQQQVSYVKAQIETRIEYFDVNKPSFYTDEIATLRADIKELQREIGNFSLDQEIRDAEKFLAKVMVDFGGKLDFEKELMPVNFSIDLKDFNFYHYNKNNNDKISLGEMGSGANWVTCHLSVLTSFMFYFISRKNSKIPAFLFLDQPSQVYFPSEFDFKKGDDNDIQQVVKIYTALIERAEGIKKRYGYAPQIIITDHADNLNLGKYDFDGFVRKRWKPGYDGALI